MKLVSGYYLRNTVKLLALLLSCFLTFENNALAANFTRNAETAKKFGTHEIVITGNGGVSNPFNTDLKLTFTLPSGTSKSVNGFYDGGSTWRARVYITESGNWTWKSTSSNDALLNNKSGSFSAVTSALRGMLKKSTASVRYWMTDNGEDFLNVSDTAYWLFDPNKTLWQQYVSENSALGVNCVRVDTFLILGDTWSIIWTDANKTQFKLPTFQTIDTRIQWILDNYPDIQLQLKVLPGTSKYAADDDYWVTLSQTTRTNLLRYYVSRFTAYPNVFFEASNDVCQANNISRCNAGTYPNNQALAREVGNYFLNNDPWKHLMSHGPVTEQPFYFVGEPWVSYVALQLPFVRLSADDSSKSAYAAYHVFMEEDEYEQDGPPAPVNPNYYYRRLFWSWLLSEGSTNYGGRVGGPYPFALVPYSMSSSLPWSKDGVNYDYKALKGLDSAKYIGAYFKNRNIKLSQFAQHDSLAGDLNNNTGEARPQLTRRSYDEFIVYHPNPTSGTVGRTAAENTSRAAKFTVNMSSASGNFNVEWYSPANGSAQTGSAVAGGATHTFTAPWSSDVVLRIVKSSSTPHPSGVYLSDISWLSAQNGWGPVERDKSNGESPAGDGRTITLNGTTYSKGLGVHANSEIAYSLNSQYASFLSDIGVDDEETTGSVTFQVWLDGTKVYDSGVMNATSTTKSINLNVNGKNTLKLVVTDAGDGANSDHGDWANARLTVGDTDHTTPSAPTGLRLVP